MKKDLAIADIRIDGGTQQRPIDDDVVAKYKSLMQDGKWDETPVDVVFDGHSYWLWDGFHRLFAHRKLGKKYIPASVEEGTKRDARWFSFSANKAHGFARQKGSAKIMLLEEIFPDPEWGSPEMTDEALAVHVGISRRAVSLYREDYERSIKRPPTSDKGNTSHTGTNESTKDSKPKNEGSAGDEPEKKEKILDSTGMEVPENLREVFSRVPEIKEHIATINQMFKTIREAVANNDELYAHCNIDSLKRDIGNLRRNLRFAKPYSVCKYCGGDVNNENCRACSGHGWVNEDAYMTTAEDLK